MLDQRRRRWANIQPTFGINITFIQILICFLFLSVGIDEEKKWLTEQENRRKRVDDVCENITLKFKGKQDRVSMQLMKNMRNSKRVNVGTHVLVHRHRKLVYCSVPKAACTSWKWFLFSQTGRYDYDHPEVLGADMHKDHTLIKEGFTIWANISFPEQKQIAEDSSYTKFFVVRHPLHRLMSAYKDKFIKQVHGQSNVSVCQSCADFGMTIVQRYRAGASQREIETGENVTLTELVKCLVETERPSFVSHDPHFDSIERVCDPCRIKYDYILHVDEMDKESDFFIHRTFPDTSLKLSHNNKHDNNGSLENRSDPLKELSTDLQIQLLTKYQNDLDMFGFTWPLARPP